MTNNLLNQYKNYMSMMALSMLTLCFFASVISVSITTILYLLTFALVLVSGSWRSRWQRISINKAALSFWILLALFFLGLTYTTSTLHLAWRDLHKRHWMLITPFLIMLIQTDIWRRRMLNAFLFASVLALILSYIKVLTPINIYHFLPNSVRELPGASVFGNRIVQGLMMSMAAFICGYRLLFEKKYRALYALLFVLMGVNVLFMSTGRTAYGIFIVLSVYLALRRFGLRGFIVACIVGSITIGAAFVLSTHFRHRVEAIYLNTKNYNDTKPINPVGQRIEMMQIAKKMIAARPWFGYGTGGIQTALPTVVPATERVYNPSIDYVENIYLNFLLQFGVFGLLVLFFVIGVQVKASFALPKQYQYLLHATLIATFFGGLFNSFLVSFVPAHLYSLFAALCLSAMPVIKENENVYD